MITPSLNTVGNEMPPRLQWAVNATDCLGTPGPCQLPAKERIWITSKRALSSAGITQPKRSIWIISKRALQPGQHQDHSARQLQAGLGDGCGWSCFLSSEHHPRDDGSGTACSVPHPRGEGWTALPALCPAVFPLHQDFICSEVLSHL